MRGLRPDSLYSWSASVDGTARATGSFTTPPAELDRPVRFAVIGDYGSGNDDEWAVGRVLAAQRPEFTVTAGDNSYLVAAEIFLDRNIFQPLGELMRNAPFYVCLGDHDTFWPGPGALSRAFDLPDGGRFVVRHGPVQVVVLGDQPNEPAAIAFAQQRAARARPGGALRRLPPAAAGRRSASCLCCARAAPRPCSAATCTATSAASSRASQSSRSAPAGRGRARSSTRGARPDAAVSLLDIGALMLEVRPGGTVGYTFLDKHGSVLDRGTL